MDALRGLGLVVAAAALLPAAGYPLAARLRANGAAERWAWATLAGLAGLLWTLAAIALVRPLDATWAWLAAWPLVALAADRRARTQAGADLRVLMRHRLVRVALAAATVPVLSILGPELRHPGMMLHDGTSNHDAYFWVSGASYLQAHTYREVPPFSRDRPWADAVRQACGWRPPAGRAAAESYLAAIASVGRVDPVRIYLPAAAALFVAWGAAVFLLVRTFYTERWTWAAAAALGALQPLFVYFVLNGNLPNLLGCLMGGLAVVALERVLRGEGSVRGGLVLGALAAHGVAFAYPEIGPFVALPGLLLAGRAAAAGRLPGRRLAGIGAALVGAVLLNPVTAWRAGFGFAHSMVAAQHEARWANLFAPLAPGEYGPALATMAIEGVRYFGPVAGAGVTLLLLASAVRTIRRAKDRFGALATLAGGAALAAYTSGTGFVYGWQKTAQFAALFVSAVLPVAALAELAPTPGPAPARRSAGRRLGAAALVAVLAVALVFHGLGNAKWSGRKSLSTAWLDLRATARTSLAGATVFVDAETFLQPYFRATWAAYFLRDCRLVFPAGDPEGAGALSAVARREDEAGPERPAAVLEGRAWAEAFDGAAPRLAEGPDFVLLRAANRLRRREGLFAERGGVPERAAGAIALEIEPRAAAEFRLTLGGIGRAPDAVATWRLTVRTDAGGTVTRDIAGPPPWRFAVPLAAGRTSRIEIMRRDAGGAGAASYPVLGIGIADPARK